MSILSNSALSPSIFERSLMSSGIFAAGVSASPSGEASLLADFIGREYRTGNDAGVDSLSELITHSRSGNAVMTDGYSPELVTNGGFDNGTDSWTASSADFSVSDGIAYFKSTGANGSISQTISTISGKLYEITFNAKYSSGDQSSVEIEGVLEYPDSPAITGSVTSFTPFKAVFVATGSSHVIKLRERGASNNASAFIDNVSVREMPVLKWAPHNLLTYSEQFDQWTLGASSTLTTNYADAPNGEQTAERVQFPASSATFVNIGMSNKKEGVPYTFAVFVKATGSNSDFGLYSNISGSITNSSTFTATNAWQLFEYTVTAGASGVTWGINNGDDSYASDILVWGAHVYRSDLGGMAGNPDQPPSRTSYVPTTSSAVYLPRIGHHVYNGSAWANEGLLAESEARTNLITYSNPDNSWTKNATTLTLNDAVSPDGTENATKITESATSSGHYVYNANVSFTSGSAYTLSAYLKAGTKSIVQLVGTNAGFGSTLYGNFDLTNGVVGSVASGVVSTIESVGNGWYRCSITGNATSTASGAAIIIALIDDLTDTRLASYTGSTSNNLYVYGTQTEQASTPSSLIPTSGSSVTRAAETFTIPSANLPWPEPNYIGSERLTGSWATPSGYDSTTSGTGTSVSVTGGTTQSRAWLSIDGVDTGEVYYIDITISNATAGGTIYLRDGASPNSGTILLTQSFTSAGGTFTGHVAAASNDMVVLLTSGVGADFDATVSVREIDPLSVSIAMDGRMTYADIDAFDKPKMFRWYDSATDRIFHSLDTNNGTGEPKFVQEANNVFDAVQGDGSEYAPDVLVPFNMASRHGSTFLNGAVDGVALTEDTTPTELPDLSATDLSLAYDYMGTIGTFRVWDRDIGDTGIVEATNPSLEPSLSLTFEGTGTNSFIVNNWSE